MSRVIATLDYIDGRTVVREIDMEVLPRFSSLWMMDKDIAGVTFTRKRSLTELATKLKETSNE